MSAPTTDQQWLARAVDLAAANVVAGGGPFGALVVSASGVVVAEGTNRVTRDLDPTAHAEVVAIRAACRALGSFSLGGTTLYSSCEPCPLCLAAALWSRVDRVVYAANRDAAADGGFDDREFYELFARERSQWHLPVDHVSVPRARSPFDVWRAHASRIDY